MRADRGNDIHAAVIIQLTALDAEQHQALRAIRAKREIVVKEIGVASRGHAVKIAHAHGAAISVGAGLHHPHTHEPVIRKRAIAAPPIRARALIVIRIDN